MILAALIAAATLSWAAPATAQTDTDSDTDPEPTGVTVLDDGEDAQPESGIVRDDDTSDTIARIRRDLLVIAGVTAVGLVVYVWHTSPARRVRVAAERAEIVLDGDDPNGT